MKNTKCYLCGNDILHERPGRVRDDKSLKIYECVACGLVFLSSFAHIDDSFYQNSSMHMKPVKLKAWREETYDDDRRRYETFKSLFKNKAVLDFGCGNGGFLLKAKDTASAVAGIELEKCWDKEFKREGLKIFRRIEDLHRTFDTITLFHVLEHIPDPVSIIVKLLDVLNKKGVILIEVPNANDALLSIYKNRAFAQFTYWSCHLFLYIKNTLKILAKKSGTKINYIRQIQRYPLSNHLYWLAKGKPAGHKEWGFLDSKELSSAYEKQLASIGCCDTLVASFSAKK
jgi:2-polyprenyl-3-methyl-5-hydroxy-6-metoxy-1,4-benzoquinol methylase